MAPRFSRPPLLVGLPLPRLAREVEMEHRGHRIDAQPVHVEALDPVARAGEEEGDDLRPTVVEDERAPVGMNRPRLLPHLVERGAVEGPQPGKVRREVSRDPVEDDPQPEPVRLIDEVREVFRRPMAGGGGEVAARLIAPARVVGVLRDREQFDVREPEVGDIPEQRVREGPVAEPRPVRLPAPGTEVCFVDRDRSAREPRAPAGSASQSASAQAYGSPETIRDAVPGLSSAARPMGSVFSTASGVVVGARSTHMELVQRSPGPTPGRKSSHTPAPPTGNMGSRLRFPLVEGAHEMPRSGRAEPTRRSAYRRPPRARRGARRA